MSTADDDADARPTLGALFRMIHASLVLEYARWLETTGYHDVKPAHAAVLQPLWRAPAGERLTTLAATASITKQSAGALVEALEASGYVERVADPDDRRATRIRLTARGRRYGRDVRRFGQQLEARLAGQVGDKRMRELRGTLERLLDTLREEARD